MYFERTWNWTVNREKMYSGYCHFEARIHFQSSVGRNCVLRKHGTAKYKLTATERKGRKIHKTKWNYWGRNQGKNIQCKKKKIQCNASKRIVWSWKFTKRWVCCWIRKLFHSWSFPMFIPPWIPLWHSWMGKGGQQAKMLHASSCLVQVMISIDCWDSGTATHCLVFTVQQGPCATIKTQAAASPPAHRGCWREDPRHGTLWFSAQRALWLSIKESRGIPDPGEVWYSLVEGKRPLGVRLVAPALSNKYLHFHSLQTSEA